MKLNQFICYSLWLIFLNNSLYFTLTIKHSHLVTFVNIQNFCQYHYIVDICIQHHSNCLFTISVLFVKLYRWLLCLFHKGHNWWSQCIFLNSKLCSCYECMDTLTLMCPECLHLSIRTHTFEISLEIPHRFFLKQQISLH